MGQMFFPGEGRTSQSSHNASNYNGNYGGGSSHNDDGWKWGAVS